MTESLQVQALKALQNGAHAEAFQLYKQIHQEHHSAKEIPGEAVYLNGGACLRILKRQQEAIEWLREGIKYYPMSAGIHKNLANNLIDLKENRWQSLFHYLMARRLGESDQNLTISLVALLHDLSFPLLAYELLRSWWVQAQDSPKDPPNSQTVRALLELGLTLFEDNELEPLAAWCLSRLEQEGPISSPAERLAMAAICVRRGDIGEGIAHYRQVEADVSQGRLADCQLFINASWNLACTLLKQGEMTLGWQLYEFGLRTPAKGAQRWQRALPKIFKASEVPIWRGEKLAAGSRMLLLCEQGIGDSMMFLQLLPSLLNQSLELTLLLPGRLVPTYQRTFPGLTIISCDEAETALEASTFDWQCPVGSLPRHLLFTWFEQGCPNVILQPPKQLKTKLRREYRKGLDKQKPIIGISWSGGAQRDRSRIKSVKADEFGEMMRSINARFVSLQYGNASRAINRWKAQDIDIAHNPEINPLVDMDSWLAQVAACDLVISVANTTIHGAGLVGVPTLCLLSRGADWRWADRVDGSYWYDCVEVARQERNGSWKQALAYAVEWSGLRMQKSKGIDMPSARHCCEQLSFKAWN